MLRLVTKKSGLQIDFSAVKAAVCQRSFDRAVPNRSVASFVQSALCVGNTRCYYETAELLNNRKKSEEVKEELKILQIHFVKCPWQQAVIACALL